MREIKFRGKRIDTGEWAYGYYAKGSTRHCILTDLGGIMYDVDPDTVGQFTGLKDRNGNDIYEGDILQLVDDAGNEIIVVCEFGIHKRKMDTGFWVEIPGFSFISPLGNPMFPIINNYTGKSDLDIMEIIGNIYENPELLTK